MAMQYYPRDILMSGKPGQAAWEVTRAKYIPVHTTASLGYKIPLVHHYELPDGLWPRRAMRREDGWVLDVPARNPNGLAKYGAVHYIPESGSFYGTTAKDVSRIAHKALVADAIENGEVVSTKVLKDYPELAQEAGLSGMGGKIVKVSAKQRAAMRKRIEKYANMDHPRKRLEAELQACLRYYNSIPYKGMSEQKALFEMSTCEVYAEMLHDAIDQL